MPAPARATYGGFYGSDKSGFLLLDQRWCDNDGRRGGTGCLLVLLVHR
jgi:hypothetical protein